MSLPKKCTRKPYYYLVTDTALASDNSLRFRRNLLERKRKQIMAIADKIRDEKLQYKIICFTLGKALEKQPKTI